jgi:ATP-binding cassette subfamily B protein
MSTQLWQLLSAARRRTLVLTLAVTLATSASANAVPVLLGQLVSALQESQDRDAITADWPGLAVFYLSIVLAVFVAREALQLVRKFLARQLGTGVEKDLTLQLVTRLLHADLKLFAGGQLGALQARVKHGVRAAAQLLKLGVQDFAPALFTIVSALAYVLCTHPLAGCVLLAAVPVMLLLAAWQRRAQKQVRLAVQEADAALGGLLVEQLAGIEYLRSANMHAREIERVAQVADDRQRSESVQQLRAAFFEAAGALNDWAFQIGIITCALLLTLNGQAQLGSTLTLWYIYFNILAALRDLYRTLDQVQESNLRLDDVQVLLHEPEDRSFRPVRHTKYSAPATNAVIDTQDVVVEYGPTRALDGVSLRIDIGEVVGIAGPSGGGKSTFAKLLLRMVHPSAGSIAFCGVPLETVSRESLARLIAYVGQEPFLFSGSVAENAAYGCEGAPRADLQRVCEQVGLHDEIMAMPGGYDAPVGERGRFLSGGQRQRLALARALLQDAPILVLDEATSALDPANEQRVLQALASDRGARTVLLVAHRPSALAAADRVLTFHHGRLECAS